MPDLYALNTGMKTAEDINILGGFCGLRDVGSLTREALFEKYAIHQADVMVLFGGSILAGGDVLAGAIRSGAAGTYVIVGGYGHTTQTLRMKIQEEFPGTDTSDLKEAQIFDAYLKLRYGLHADYLETESTNCGNNITNLLKLMEAEHIPCRNIILTQDATMQRRMAAVMRKHRPDLQVINYAAYQARVVCSGESFSFETDICGMWEVSRYVNLLMGEIPRLRDDQNGYGPQGAGYLAHVDIPDKVEEAFEKLKERFEIRKANPAFASRCFPETVSGRGYWFSRRKDESGEIKRKK